MTLEGEGSCAAGEAGEGRPSIAQDEEQLQRNLELLDDALLQYEYVLAFAGDLDELPQGECRDANKVAGCASNAWMELSARDGCLTLRMSSDALVIKGLLGVISWLVCGRPLAEVAAWEPQLLEFPQLKPLLNSDRRHGVASIISQIRRFASQGCGSEAPAGSAHRML